MSAFLITKKDSKVLDMPVYAADETEEIVTVFTCEKSAQRYIDDADWSEDYTVATLDPIAFLEWLLECHRSGVDMIATDPNRSEQMAGQKLSSLSIEAHLQHAGEHILTTANPEF